MVDALEAATSTRRRRSDARRSVAAILNAARSVLEQRPDASMEEIATVAGVTRQTVYAHFPSRDALVGTIIDQAGAEFLDALDAADLDTRTPTEALSGFLEIGWRLVRRYLPLLLNSTVAHPQTDDPGDPHHPVTTRLEQIIRRGQRTGEFDRALPPAWLADAILRLGHTAAAHEASGQRGAAKAAALLRESALRLCGGTRTPR
jgi:AcrR family transcriptional regulator